MSEALGAGSLCPIVGRSVNASRPQAFPKVRTLYPLGGDADHFRPFSELFPTSLPQPRWAKTTNKGAAE
jgi:hypothetical protein